MISSLAFMLMQTTASDDMSKSCDDPQTQHQMNVCAYDDYQAANEKLNTQWKITYARMKSLDESHEDDGRIGYADALLEAQRHWITFRDIHCLSESYRFRGGSAEPLLRYNCLTSETSRRTEALVELVAEG